MSSEKPIGNINIAKEGKMYNVMIRIGNSRKSKRAVFEDPVKAEEYFNELCRRRTEYPATVVLAYRILVKKKISHRQRLQG